MPERSLSSKRGRESDPFEALRAVRSAASDQQHREDVGADGVLDSLVVFIENFLDEQEAR